MRQNLIHQRVFDRILRYLDDHNTWKGSNRSYVSNEVVLYEVLRVLKYGVPWRDADSLKKCSWKTVYHRFRTWVIDRKFIRLWKNPIKRYAHEKLQSDPMWFQNIFIDVTMVKNMKGTEFVGRNPTDRGRLGSKISIVCDRNQVVIGATISGANVSDCTLTEPTLDDIRIPLKTSDSVTTYLVGDKGYSSARLSDTLKHRETQRVYLIAPRKKKHRPPNKECTQNRFKDVLRKRHVVENTFCNLKKFERLAKRRDASVASFRAFFALAAVIRTLSRCSL